MNVKPLRMEKQARPPRADRVLGLLPPQLAADPPLPAGLARALRRGGAGLRVVSSTAPASRRATTPRPSRAAVARLGIQYPVASTRSFVLWRAYDNAGWPARYLFDAAAEAVRDPPRRGRLRRDRAGDPGAARASSASSSRPSTPRTSPTRRSSCRRPTSRAPTRGPTPRARSGSSSSGAGVVDGQRRAGRARAPRRALRRRARAPHRGDRRRLGPGAGVIVHATCFTPGLAPTGAVSAAALTSSATARGAAACPSSRTTAPPGQYGLAARRRCRSTRRPSTPRCAGARPTASSTRRGLLARRAARRSGCGRRSRGRRARRARTITAPIAAMLAWRSPSEARSACTGPRPARLMPAIPSGSAPASARPRSGARPSADSSDQAFAVAAAVGAGAAARRAALAISSSHAYIGASAASKSSGDAAVRERARARRAPSRPRRGARTSGSCRAVEVVAVRRPDVLAQPDARVGDVDRARAPSQPRDRAASPTRRGRRRAPRARSGWRLGARRAGQPRGDERGGRGCRR